MAYNKAAFNSHKNQAKYTAGYKQNKATISKQKKLFSTPPEENDADWFPKQQPYEKPLYLRIRKKPQNYLDESRMWIGKKYVFNNTIDRRLQIGDLVFVHPAFACQTMFVGIVWFQKGSSKVTTTKWGATYNEYKTNLSYSIIVKTLEGISVSDDDSPFPSLWEEDIMERENVNDVWVDDKSFTRLQPVEWWVGKKATTKCDEFKALAAMLNIHPKVYAELP